MGGKAAHDDLELARTAPLFAHFQGDGNASESMIGLNRNH